jgi:serine/threonine protein kinase
VNAEETWEAALERRIIEVHRGAQSAGSSDVPDRLKEIFELGGVDINVTLKNSTVRLLHRAAYLGNLQLIEFLLTEVHTMAWVDVLNVKDAGGYTPLHWCAAACGTGNDSDAQERYGSVAHFLLESGSDPTIVNSRGQTAWDVAHTAKSDGVLHTFKDYAALAPTGAGGAVAQALWKEQERRSRRPAVAQTFRDDIELAMERFTLWDVDEPCESFSPRAEGGFGVIYLHQDISPSVEVAGKLFRCAAVKVPKPHAVPELKEEVVSLSNLSHENVVQILGMVEGTGPKGAEAWMMILEWCSSDVTKMLYNRDDDAYGHYSLEGVCELAEQISQGLVYIHGQNVAHLDLKPENILLAKHDGKYTAKLADFGMQYTTPNKSAETGGAEAASAAADGGSAAAADGGSAGPSSSVANDQSEDKDAIVPYGTWEYLSPECYKRKYGEPCCASDIFSFGLVLWEMLARCRISEHLLDEDQPSHTCMIDGQVTLNVKVVPKCFLKGERPRYTGLRPELREQRSSPVYYRIMQACWVADSSARPTATQILQALRLAKSRAANVTTEQFTHETAAIEAEAAAAMASKAAAEAQAESGGATAEAEMTYDAFLMKLGLLDKKEDLAEYLSDPGQELVELKQMDQDDLQDDILDDPGLGLDEATKTKFEQELQVLKDAAAAADEQQQQQPVSEFDPGVIAAAVEAAAEREKQWPKWPALQQMLPGLPGLHEGASDEIEELRRRIDEQAKENQQRVDEQVKENQELRALLLLAQSESAGAAASAVTDEGIPPRSAEGPHL